MMAEQERIWTVSEVNAAIREVIEGGFFPFWLEGEVGNLTVHRSGHVYLTLKDARSQLRAVFFNGAPAARRLGLKVGDRVEAVGRLGVYEVRGEYQFTIRELRPVGLGELQRRFEALKAKLADEGLFAAERKKPIPLLPKRIGLVTSPDGAAVRDFLQIIRRRFPDLHLRLVPAAVQGKDAARQVAAGIAFLNRIRGADVIIVTRGGGSLEDLWPFNEEILARAIAASAIPVISAVGHEIDVTISDLVADLRAPTPSAAAELVVSRQEEFRERIEALGRRLRGALELVAARFRARFDRAAHSWVFREPVHLLRRRQQEVDDLAGRLARALDAARERARRRLERAEARLHALNPAAVLARGYAILTEAGTGRLVADPALPAGTPVRAQMAAGDLSLVVMPGTAPAPAGE
jgi:exodeoxyribonuclease VII large subunit